MEPSRNSNSNHESVRHSLNRSAGQLGTLAQYVRPACLRFAVSQHLEQSDRRRRSRSACRSAPVTRAMLRPWSPRAWTVQGTAVNATTINAAAIASDALSRSELVAGIGIGVETLDPLACENRPNTLGIGHFTNDRIELGELSKVALASAESRNSCCRASDSASLIRPSSQATIRFSRSSWFMLLPPVLVLRQVEHRRHANAG